MSDHDSQPQQCDCGRGWFNPEVYVECAQCRRELIAAINVVRRVFPGSRIVGAPSLPYPEGGWGSG